MTPVGFDVALEEDKAQTASLGSETIGWLASEPGGWEALQQQAAHQGILQEVEKGTFWQQMSG